MVNQRQPLWAYYLQKMVHDCCSTSRGCQQLSKVFQLFEIVVDNGSMGQVRSIFIDTHEP